MNTRTTKAGKKDNNKIYSKALYSDEHGYCLTVLEYHPKDKSFDFVTEYFDLDTISFNSLSTSIEDCEKHFSQKIRTDKKLEDKLDLKSRVRWEIFTEIDYQKDLMHIVGFLKDKRLRIESPELKTVIEKYDPENSQKSHRVKALMLAIAKKPSFNEMWYWELYDSTNT